MVYSDAQSWKYKILRKTTNMNDNIDDLDQDDVSDSDQTQDKVNIPDGVAQLPSALVRPLVPQQLQPNHNGRKDLCQSHTHCKEGGLGLGLPRGLAEEECFEVW